MVQRQLRNPPPVRHCLLLTDVLVKLDLERFGVSGRSTAHLFVGRVLLVAVGITDGRL